MSTRHLTRQETRQPRHAVQDEYQRQLESEGRWRVEGREAEVTRRDVWGLLLGSKVGRAEEKVPDSLNGLGAKTSSLFYKTLPKWKRIPIFVLLQTCAEAVSPHPQGPDSTELAHVFQKRRIIQN